MNYFLAVGYPLQAGVSSDTLYTTIELRGTTVTLLGEHALLWSRLFQLEQLGTKDQMIASQLVELGVVIMAENPADFLGSLFRLCPIRQGFSIAKEQETLVCLGDGRWALTPLQMRLWAASDGCRSFAQVLKLSEPWKPSVLEPLMELMALELLYFH
jgi:hypothetical protein